MFETVLCGDVSSLWPEGFLQLMVFDRVSWQVTLLFCHSSLRCKPSWLGILWLTYFAMIQPSEGFEWASTGLKCLCVSVSERWLRGRAGRSWISGARTPTSTCFSLPPRKCNSQTRFRCQNSIPQTWAKTRSDMVMEKNGKDYDPSYEYSSLWCLITFLKQLSTNHVCCCENYYITLDKLLSNKSS